MRAWRTALSGRPAGGVSLLSGLGVLAVFGCLLYLAGRLLPLYFEARAVGDVLTSVAQSGAADAASIRSGLEAGFAGAGVNTITAADVEVLADARGRRLEARYDAVAPLLGDLGLVLHVHRTATLVATDAP